MCMQVPSEAKRGIGSLAARVTGSHAFSWMLRTVLKSSGRTAVSPAQAVILYCCFSRYRSSLSSGFTWLTFEVFCCPYPSYGTFIPCHGRRSHPLCNYVLASVSLVLDFSSYFDKKKNPLVIGSFCIWSFFPWMLITILAYMLRSLNVYHQISMNYTLIVSQYKYFSSLKIYVIITFVCVCICTHVLVPTLSAMTHGQRTTLEVCSLSCVFGGIKLRSSGLATHSFTNWVILPAIFCLKFLPGLPFPASFLAIVWRNFPLSVLRFVDLIIPPWLITL